LFALLWAAQVLAAGPQPPPGWGKQQPKKEEPKKAGDLIAGEASFKHGNTARTFKFVWGELSKVEQTGWLNLTVDFLEAKDTDRNFLAKQGRFLRLMLVAEKAGEVIPAQISMLVAKDEQGISKKTGKACQLKLTKLTAKEVAGQGSCPSGMVDQDNKPARPVTEIRFWAKAQ
jgi:hypothetical protein